jgi:hypothetical protein
MSHPVNDTIYDAVVDHISGMTLDEFQNQCEEYKLNTSCIDELANNLMQHLIEEKFTT